MSAYPTNIVFLIVVAMAIAGIAVWFSLSGALQTLSLPSSVKRNWRWGIGLVLALWFGVRYALALNPPGSPVLTAPYVFGFVAFGITAGTLPLLLSSTFREIIRATPPSQIIGIHAGRVVGGLFLTLMDMKLAPANFALPAGYGDVAVALLAVVVVYTLAAHKPYARTLIIIWNLLGLLDFITALVTGSLYIPSFVSQLIASGISPSYMNYVLMIPTFGVPLIGVLHVYSLYQVFSRRGEALKPGLAAIRA